MSIPIKHKAVAKVVPRPMNYDFGKNWKTKIKPVLDDPKIKRALKAGMDSYLSDFPGKRKYKANTCPATYSSKDAYCELIERKHCNIMKDLRKSGHLPREYLELAQALNVGEDDYIIDFKDKDVNDEEEAASDDDVDEEEDVRDVDEEENYDSEEYDEKREILDKLREQILTPYDEWVQIKYDLESYYVSGACHTYNAIFGLVLAKMVEPEEVWRVRNGVKHTTVINKDNMKVFDLLYWCCDGRVENYMFGIPVETADSTMGGKDAYLDSA